MSCTMRRGSIETEMVGPWEEGDGEKAVRGRSESRKDSNTILPQSPEDSPETPRYVGGKEREKRHMERRRGKERERADGRSVMPALCGLLSSINPTATEDRRRMETVH